MTTGFSSVLFPDGVDMNGNTARKLGLIERHDLPMEAACLKFLEIDAKAKGGGVQFEGYGSVWGRVDSWGDTVLRGAFAESIQKKRPLMLFGHSPGRVPGKWLTFAEDDTGLLMRGELTPGHSEAADIAASLKHGSLNGLSIGGYTTDWETTKEGTRIIKAFDLFEVSIVSMPAEDEARVDLASVKSAVDLCEKVSDVEDLLREAAGLSKSAATAIVSRLARILRSESDGVSEASESAKLAETLRTLKIPTSILGARK